MRLVKLYRKWKKESKVPTCDKIYERKKIFLNKKFCENKNLQKKFLNHDEKNSTKKFLYFFRIV